MHRHSFHRRPFNCHRESTSIRLTFFYSPCPEAMSMSVCGLEELAIGGKVLFEVSDKIQCPHSVHAQQCQQSDSEQFSSEIPLWFSINCCFLLSCSRDISAQSILLWLARIQASNNFEHLIIVLRQTWKNVSLPYHLTSKPDEEQAWWCGWSWYQSPIKASSLFSLNHIKLLRGQWMSLNHHSALTRSDLTKMEKK